MDIFFDPQSGVRLTDEPLLFDGCCGAGGGTVGYMRTGFKVVGVDIAPQPRYPSQFIQGDVLDFVRRYGDQFDAIHVSPPCQAYSVCKGMPHNRSNTYPTLIKPVREALIKSGRPFVIENVPGARREMYATIILCGSMFGLKVYRHRLFESNYMLFQPNHLAHSERTGGYRPNGLLSRKPPPDWDGYITVAGNNFRVYQAKKRWGLTG